MSTATGSFNFHPPGGLAAADRCRYGRPRDEAARQSERREDWDAAIDFVIRVLKSAPGTELGTTARRTLTYLMARRDGDLRYRVMDYRGAAMFYEQAVAAEPAKVDTAIRLAVVSAGHTGARRHPRARIRARPRRVPGRRKSRRHAAKT